jgi:hypothetical protein
MAIQLRHKNITLDGTSIPFTIDVSEGVDIYNILNTSVTLTNNKSIIYTGTPEKGLQVVLIFNGGFNFDSNIFTVLGTVIPSFYQDRIFRLDCIYNGSNWIVSLYAPLNQNSIVGPNNITSIGNSLINDEAITLSKLNNSIRTFSVNGNSTNLGGNINIVEYINNTDSNGEIILDVTNGTLEATIGEISGVKIEDGTIDADKLNFSTEKSFLNYFDFSSGSTTEVTTSNTWYKLNTNTTEGLSRFGMVHSNNRITNNENPKIVKITAVITIQTSTSQEIHIAFFLNEGEGFNIVPCSEQFQLTVNKGGAYVAENITAQCLVELQGNAQLEVWVKNFSTDDDITLENINVIAQEL